MMRWLRALFGQLPYPDADVYREMSIPPVRVMLAGPLQVVDVRALAEPDRALSTGVRVGVEICRTLPAAEQRAFFFAPAVVQELLAGEGSGLRELLPLLLEKVDLDFQLGLFVEPALMSAAARVCASLNVLAVPSEGPGSNEIQARIGAVHNEGFVVPHPNALIDMCNISGIPGVAIRYDDEVIIDLRRVGVGETALSTGLLAARMALDTFESPRRRTWIIADWLAHPDSLEQATSFARKAVANNPPDEVDQIVVEGECTTPLRSWIAELGLRLHSAPRQVALGLELPYPQLAQYIMLAAAANAA